MINEITTTTLRNRKMGKGAVKGKGDATAVIKDAQSTGTHVAEKKTPSKNKAAAAGVMTAVPFSPAHENTENKYEGSWKDSSDDYRAARRMGKSVEDYEGSARDRIADNAGEKRMRDGGERPKTAPGYKQGVAAFKNSPKASHGYGHKPGNCDGHLRCSGASGAHRIGKK